jgi:ankyrin repeat protein
MDPITAVGLVASVVQIADASFRIMKVLETLKEGAKDRRKLSDEITVLWMTLRNLETQFAPLSGEVSGAWMKPLDGLAEPGGVFDQLRAALDEVYEKLATSESSFGRAMQTLRWPLTQAYVDRTVAKIERLKSSIVLVGEQANIALAQEMRGDVAAVKATVDDGHFKEVMDWLSPLNFRQKQESIAVSPGTGTWFFASEEFQSWHTGDDRWFWCYGIPGAGKTFLASNTANELRKIHQSDGALVLIAFCSFNSADSQSLEHLVASLLKQIAQAQKTIPVGVQKLFKKHHVSETRPTLDELRDLLSNELAKSPKAFILLDALDELADDSKRIALLDTLFKLKSKPKIMLTSRKIESIANRFGYTMDGIYCDGCAKKHLDIYHHCEDCVDFDYCADCLEKTEGVGHVFVPRYSSIKLRIAAQPEDIQSYVNRRIDIEEDLRQFVERQPKLRFQILETIVENAQDMFLLARLHMDALADCLTPSQLQAALSTLPNGIDATYDNAMARIEKLSRNRQRMVKKLLMWVSYAQRPMSVQELEHATAISRGARVIPPDTIVSARVLTSLSAGLVIIDEDDYVRLTHKTAETYFTGKRATLFPQGDVEVAECCLAYLQLQDFANGPCVGPDESDDFDARLKSYPFLAYAAQYWGTHTQIGQSDIVTPQALLFLRNVNALGVCVQTMWYSDTEEFDSWDVPAGVDALHVASYFGLSTIVAGLLSDGADPNSRDPLGTTALIYACSNGHLNVVNILLSAGADPSLLDKRVSTALHRAVKLEHVELTKRLVQEANVGINEFYTAWKNFTPLIIAVWHCNLAIVEILLERADIDVNLGSPPQRWNPLLLASSAGRADILAALLQHPNIEKDYQDSERSTAMYYAATNGHIPCLELLLQSGCDPNVERPVHHAVDDNELESVKTLVKYGVETNFTDYLGRNILHAGAVNNRSEILRFLLQTGVDVGVNDQGNNGETPLHDAANCDYVDTINVLLEFGARTDVVNTSGRSPVRIAIDAGHTRTIELLRAARAKEQAINEPGGYGSLRKADTFATKKDLPFHMLIPQGSAESIRLRVATMSPEEVNEPTLDTLDKCTALHLACQYRGLDVINPLLEAGADPNHADAFGRSPLTAACQVADFEAVQALVKYGADVNFCKFTSRYPWEIALANGGSKAAVFLLAQPQTIIKPDNGQLRKGLGWAAALGDMEACKRLVAAGAPAHLKNANGSSPAQIAKGWDHRDVEKFLIEAAAQQLQQLPTKLLGLETKVEGDDEEDEDDRAFHPPTRSPTAKKEFVELVCLTRKLTMPVTNGLVELKRMDSSREDHSHVMITNSSSGRTA